MIKRLLLILILLFPVNALATDWYVDKSASGTNAGTSWTNAWESFANIVWAGAGVVAGDTLYISGGAAGQTYAETLTIGVSGSSGNQVTIKSGAAAPSPSGHGGLVTITDTDGNGIYSVKQYTTVDGNDGAGNRNIRLTGNYKSGVLLANAVLGTVITYLTIDTNAPAGAVVADREGIRVTNLTDSVNQRVEISYCDIYNNYQDQISISGNSVGSTFDTVLIHHNDIHALNDDGIEMGYISGVSVYNNTFYGWGNSGGGGHPDQLVSNGAGNLKWYNNYFYGWEDDNHILSSNMLPSGQTSADAREVTDVWIFNNFIYNTDLTPTADGSDSVARGIELTNGPGSSVTAMKRFYIFNNTIINQPFYAIYVGIGNAITVEDVLVYNNIINGAGIATTNAMTVDVGTHTIGSDGDSVDVIIDYNIFYAGDAGTTDIGYNGAVAYTTFKTNSNCQDTDASSPVDPKNNSNGTLQSDSPAIGAGKDLSALCSTVSEFCNDKNGNARSAWAIGADEWFLQNGLNGGSGSGSTR